jgi:hypothetical protein
MQEYLPIKVEGFAFMDKELKYKPLNLILPIATLSFSSPETVGGKFLLHTWIYAYQKYASTFDQAFAVDGK